MEELNIIKIVDDNDRINLKGELREAITQMNLVNEGKLQTKSADEFMNEL